jgi:cyclic pyranopterin phosphate synthase
MTPLPALKTQAPLIDGFGRAVTYLRLSVTDRCDLRCVYCMPERMEFLPKAEVLSLEELSRIARAFIRLGVSKIRVTGGEPLGRKGVVGLVSDLVGEGVEEVTLTTNATRLAEFADDLAAAGVRRINVSLDTLKPDLFRTLTRGGDVAQVLAGIAAAQAAGLAVKINAVALKDNVSELPELVAWAHGLGMDITLIEAMPLGEVGGYRAEQQLSLAHVRDQLASFWTLAELPDRTGGPARYVRVAQTGGRLGFIAPHSHNFCEACNRVRLTCTGVLHGCLGREDARDLRAVIRSGGADADLEDAIRAAIDAKPKGHDFDPARLAHPRHMSTTGG